MLSCQRCLREPHGVPRVTSADDPIQPTLPTVSGLTDHLLRVPRCEFFRSWSVAPGVLVEGSVGEYRGHLFSMLD